LSDRQGVAVCIPEVGDLGTAYERSCAFLVRGDRSFVEALEADGPLLVCVLQRVHVADHDPAVTSCSPKLIRAFPDYGS
jgi:hypothetical protein